MFCYFRRSKGRIVEAMIENFSALAGAGSLLVIIQNTGRVTADYLVITCNVVVVFGMS